MVGTHLKMIAAGVLVSLGTLAMPTNAMAQHARERRRARPGRRPIPSESGASFSKKSLLPQVSK